MLLVSCIYDNSSGTTTIPDDNIVISILKSRSWDLVSVTYSQSFDINCDDNDTNSPKINRCQTKFFLSLNLILLTQLNVPV